MQSLAHSLILQARQRLRVLVVLMNDQAWNVVVREAQECVELALKGLLRTAGVEPPKIHDVGSLLLTHRQRFEGRGYPTDLDRLADISKRLRKDRELSFYGDTDFIPSESYSENHAREALRDAAFAVEHAEAALAANQSRE